MDSAHEIEMNCATDEESVLNFPGLIWKENVYLHKSLWLWVVYAFVWLKKYCSINSSDYHIQT